MLETKVDRNCANIFVVTLTLKWRKTLWYKHIICQRVEEIRCKTMFNKPCLRTCCIIVHMNSSEYATGALVSTAYFLKLFQFACTAVSYKLCLNPLTTTKKIFFKYSFEQISARLLKTFILFYQVLDMTFGWRKLNLNVWHSTLWSCMRNSPREKVLNIWISVYLICKNMFMIKF